MTARGVEHVESLRESLACPACAYSLRGLPGDAVTCPECGLAINVPALIARQWSRPWWEAPLYNTMALPMAWVMLIALCSPAAFGLASGAGESGHLVVLIYFALAILSWVGVMQFVAARFGSLEGVALALLLHLVIPAYIGGLGMLVSGVVGVMIALSEQRWYIVHWYAMVLVGGGVATAAGRLIERYVAHRCIKRHLRSAGPV